MNATDAPKPRHLADTCLGYGRRHVLGAEPDCPYCVVACIKDDHRKRKKHRPGWPARACAWLGRQIGYVARRARRAEVAE